MEMKRQHSIGKNPIFRNSLFGEIQIQSHQQYFELRPASRNIISPEHKEIILNISPGAITKM